MFWKRVAKGLLLFTIVFFSNTLALGASREQKKIVIGKSDWPSVNVHAHIAGFILEKGYGYKVEYKTATHTAILLSIARGDVDAYMESWTDNNVEPIQKHTTEGKLLDLGSNFEGATQGWFVPTYLIKGDSKRGIEAVATDLRSVKDLAKYWELFKDPAFPKKGRLYNAISSWPAYDVNLAKLKTYGLDDYYTSFSPGSDAALVAAVTSAYRQGKPFLFWYWTPSWPIGAMDLTMLEEPEYSLEVWKKNKGCHPPIFKVHILSSPSLAEKAPEAISFLSNYETTLRQNNELLAYLEEKKLPDEEAALWFLRKYPEHWHSWFPIPGEYSDKIIANVSNALTKE